MPIFAVGGGRQCSKKYSFPGIGISISRKIFILYISVQKHLNSPPLPKFLSKYSAQISWKTSSQLPNFFHSRKVGESYLTNYKSFNGIHALTQQKWKHKNNARSVNISKRHADNFVRMQCIVNVCFGFTNLKVKFVCVYSSCFSRCTSEVR